MMSSDLKSAAKPAYAVASPCVTCDLLFNRPNVVIDELEPAMYSEDTSKTEVIRIDKQQLRASAEAGCDLCSVQWQYAQHAYQQGLNCELTFEESEMSISLVWRKNRRSEAPTFALEVFWPSLQVTQKGSVGFGMDIMLSSEIKDAVKTPLDLPVSTSSANCETLALKWWEACTYTHQACQVDSEPWLPTRLLDLDGIPNLVMTKGLSKSPAPKYVALSHRWGASPDKVFRLLSTNEKDLMNVLPLDRLSQIFRDAISFTKRIGVRYLWIDSLCIMQDSEDDWKAEAAMMSKVYMLCALNIAADPVTSTTSGMFQERTSQDLRCISTHEKTVVRNNFQQKYLITLERNSDFEVDKRRCLQGRAWVFQERLLSPRTLHFSDQLFWECRHNRASETFPTRVPNMDMRSSLKNWKPRLYLDTYTFWHKLLHSYLLCALTFPSDRLVALGAVAKEFEPRLKTGYCAGLWWGQMPGCLVWALEPVRKAEDLPKRQTKYRCPTWSWASLDFTQGTLIHSAVDTDHWDQLLDPLVTVFDISINSPFGNNHTDIASAEIVLQGYLRAVDLSSLGTYGYWPDAFDEESLCGYILDLGPDSAGGVDMYLLPVVIETDTEDVFALLLKATQTSASVFERIGMATIGRQTCPDELCWVFELADMEDCLEDAPHRIVLV